MSIVVEVTVPDGGFALPDVLPAAPEDTFRAVRLVAHESGHAMPYLWVDCADAQRLQQAMAEDPSVREFAVLAAYDGQCFLRVEWVPRVQVFLSVLQAEDAYVLAATGYDGVWHLRLYFAAHDCVTAARKCCETRGIDVSFGTENGRSETTGFGFFGLTECQYQTLVTAYEQGYYDVPRGITQEELADRLDITHQALSERIRRAHETLVENGLPRAVHQRGPALSPPPSAVVDD